MNIYQRIMGSTTYSPPDAAAGEGGGTDAAAAATAVAAAATSLKNGSEGGEGGGADDKWKGLVTDPDNLAYVKTKNWQSPEETVKSYRELEAEASKAKDLKLPTKDSKPEEVDKFFEALGRPKEAKGYEFKIADSVPDNFPYEEATADAFKEVALKANLLPEQAQTIHDWYVENTSQSFTGELQSTAKRIEGAHKAIVAEFGDPSGSEYQRKVELADRAVRELSPGKDKKALRAELVQIGAMTPDGKVMAPNLIIALSRIGQELYSEDKVYSGISAEKNPWKKESENLTEQGKIIGEDPEMARQLILAANLNPKDFGLNAPTK